MKEKISNIWEFILDLLFPPVCLVCRKRLNQSKTTNLSESTNYPNSFSFLCCSCSQKIQINSTLDKKTGLAAAVSYNDEIPRQLIFLLKYQKIKTAAVPLAEILTQYIGDLTLDIRNFSIVPVPLHWRREKERGFNQSYLIAEQLSKNTGLPVLKNVLKRIRNTPSQVELKEKKKREMNVRGCFRVEKTELLFQKNIIILDDVSTSGATMKEAIKVIKTSGAAKIIGLVVAKV